MAYLMGLGLGLVTAALGRIAGFDRERAFYATILMVIPCYYILFAVMGGSTRALTIACAVTVVFFAIAIAGFRSNPWLISGGLAAHGIYDYIHRYFAEDSGVPLWWPAFCLTIDVVLAAVVATILVQDKENPARLRPTRSE